MTRLWQAYRRWLERRPQFWRYRSGPMFDAHDRLAWWLARHHLLVVEEGGWYVEAEWSWTAWWSELPRPAFR